jgi:hypothetical protein
MQLRLDQGVCAVLCALQVLRAGVIVRGNEMREWMYGMDRAGIS